MVKHAFSLAASCIYTMYLAVCFYVLISRHCVYIIILHALNISAYSACSGSPHDAMHLPSIVVFLVLLRNHVKCIH